jgi:citrate lyase subunit beta / citryl-CoA lyase
MQRDFNFCRSWLFVAGADRDALMAAPASGADVLIQEMEDFTPPELLPRAREMAADIYHHWRLSGAVVAVRINPLSGPGLDDLAAVMHAAPDVVALPKVAGAEDVAALDAAVTRFEQDYGLPAGQTRLLPNVESARGLVRLGEIAAASERTVGCLVASEDLAADLGAERGPDGCELAYARQRFLLECVAASMLAVDCPYTWEDTEGLERDVRWAKRIGYKAKSAVLSRHADTINAIFTPTALDVAAARRLVNAFEAARVRGEARVEIDGSLVEVPTYLNAKRLLARAAGFDLGSLKVR